MDTLDEALELMKKRWWGDRVPRDKDMRHVVKLLRMAQQQVAELEEKYIKVNLELTDLLVSELVLKKQLFSV